MAEDSDVVRVRDIAGDAITELAARYSVNIEWRAPDAAIENSFWGAPEAGISADGLALSDATPVHSLLHELCHIICMSSQRRARLDRDAGGTDEEECGVCYLQVLLADRLPGFSAERCLCDMDNWGYSFREGSAATWFSGDGRDARGWLLRHRLIDENDRPTFRLRD